MATISPFRAIRYDFSSFDGNISNLISPPYDVLDQSDKDELLGKNDKNIVSIDLPHIPPKSLGPEEVYKQANKTLLELIDEGTMLREDTPCLYVYHQTFHFDGESFTRKMLICNVRLHGFDEGVILPHEKTFGGPKEDRLALMKHTGCNVSPIFGLYRDPQNSVISLVDSITNNTPDAHGILEDVENKVWIVNDQTLIGKIVSYFEDQKLYIADGHHRYGTALNYRDWARDNVEGFTPDHPSNDCMFVLASMDDPGCVIWPYHRTLGHIKLEQLLDIWEPGLKQVEQSHADLSLFDPKSNSLTHVQYSNRDILRTLESDQCEAWYNLDAAYLHRYLIDDLLTKNEGSPEIFYVKSDAQAKEAAEQNSGIALLVKATPMKHLQDISDQKGLMPQKSTFFYPKLATGLTINPLF